MSESPHLFGIRHHGPGSARSLVRAFDSLKPDCVLIEGPPESNDLIAAVVDEEMRPPVALLGYCPDDAKLAVYHPFAVFSPEWQALRWAVERQVPVRFIDLPLAHGLALEKEKRDAAEKRAQEMAEAISLDSTLPEDAEPAPMEMPKPATDPLSWLATAAGYADGESWWNHMVEERGDGEELFAAILEAMTAVRADLPETKNDPDEARREVLREAYMRTQVRAAVKDGFTRIAVVCGAWHLGALQAKTPAKDDAALLKGLPKVKVASTWVPWTYRHLTYTSGYGAGVHSPGWYEHLWTSTGKGESRTVGWLARVARLLRAKDLDCSSAHLIEASRLAETLAALRERPAPGLDDIHEATRTVLTMGDDAALRFIDDALIVGDVMGRVPPTVPVVPLQRDLEQTQKSLRLKAEATQRTLDLDLREQNDLARSHLLHRLNVLGIAWGELAKVGRSTRGTFHEVWTLQWQPEFALQLIEASRWGQTVAEAAAATAIDAARNAESLTELATLVDRVLLASLDKAIPTVTQALENRAALSGDASQLLAALPALANIFRYGNVRQTDASLVAHVLDSLIVRAAIALPLACRGIDDGAATALREKLLAAGAAIALRQGEEQTAAWHLALANITASETAHELLQGLASRLLLDEGVRDADETAIALSLHLSSGNEPAKAAAWLEGFINRNAQVLLHDAAVWNLVNQWLTGLGEEHFVRILPLVRRTFSAFAANERHDLGQRARQGITVKAATVAPSWDAARAALPIPLLKQIMGLPS